jgi:hypothetical protein
LLGVPVVLGGRGPVVDVVQLFAVDAHVEVDLRLEGVDRATVARVPLVHVQHKPFEAIERAVGQNPARRHLYGKEWWAPNLLAIVALVVMYRKSSISRTSTPGW